jgi:hypothetical protein
MSLTSYRAAPPRANRKFVRPAWAMRGLGPASLHKRERGARWNRCAAIVGVVKKGLSFAGPATTYSPGS